MNRYSEIWSNLEMEMMMLDLFEKIMKEVNCFLILLDDYYHEIFGNIFNGHLDSHPHFKVSTLKSLYFYNNTVTRVHIFPPPSKKTYLKIPIAATSIM